MVIVKQAAGVIQEEVANTAASNQIAMGKMKEEAERASEKGMKLEMECSTNMHRAQCIMLCIEALPHVPSEVVEQVLQGGHASAASCSMRGLSTNGLLAAQRQLECDCEGECEGRKCESRLYQNGNKGSPTRRCPTLQPHPSRHPPPTSWPRSNHSPWRLCKISLKFKWVLPHVFPFTPRSFAGSATGLRQQIE